MRVSYSEGYHVPLPEGHAFPMDKFPALRAILLDEGLLSETDIVEPTEASWSDLALVHTDEYLRKLRTGEFERAEIRRLGLPWSRGLVRRSRLAVRGTVNAAWMAIEDGVAANLAGGTHHAFPDHGEGFCVLNDVGVAVRTLRRAGWIDRALVIDVDVHQGNGTAAVFAGDDETYTFSIHGARNYPFLKRPSDLDLALPDGATDDAYLRMLEAGLRRAFEEANPDLVFYLGGVDVVAGDRFGRLALTRDGLEARDRMAIGMAMERDLPLAILLSGGYARTPRATADLHAVAHRVASAARVARRAGGIAS